MGMIDRVAPYIEYIDEAPINFRKIVKKVSENGTWEEKVFYQMIMSEKEKYKVKEWLYDRYGEPSYGGTWWMTHSTIVMIDKIYTHWKLSE
jgi:hypothetical protein